MRAPSCAWIALSTTKPISPATCSANSAIVSNSHHSISSMLRISLLPNRNRAPCARVPAARPVEETSHACKIKGAAKGSGRCFVRQARRHAKEQAQGRLEVDGQLDEREAARGDGVDEKEGQAGARER